MKASMLKSEMSMETHRYTLLRNKVSKRYLSFCFAGAKINAVTLAGNTVLHYCFTYSFESLGEYFISKPDDRSQMQQVS